MSTTAWEAEFDERFYEDFEGVLVKENGLGARAVSKDELKSFIREVEQRAEERGRNEAVREISGTIGIVDGKLVAAPRNFLQTVLDALQRARTPNEATEARGEDINKTTNP